jgi:hypothetical protein
MPDELGALRSALDWLLVAPRPLPFIEFAPRQYKSSIPLRDSHATTIMPMPRPRIPILIVAVFPSTSPRYHWTPHPVTIA